MYRSPTKQTTYRSPTPSRNNFANSKSPKSSSNPNPLYFCHYKNAMYMGGIKSFKKDGRGILLHDCGLSVLTSYLNDLMHGHNVFFSQHCLLSAEFVKGKLVEAVYRTDGFLGYFHFNNESQLEGKCILLNFTSKTLTYVSFKKGIMFDKREEGDFTILNRVFDLADFDFLIGRVHTRVMKYEFDKVNTIEGQKYGNKLTIGFQKGGLINGLGFTLVFRGSHGGYNPETHRSEDDFELKVIERGYMINSQLNGFGEKWFKNGNLYIGQFKTGIFQGNGILRNVSKRNWVSGYFEKGNLVQLIEYNNEGQSKSEDRIVETLHQRKTNWINNEVHLLSMELFDGHIERIIIGNPTAAVRSLEERKHEVLRKIQDNFICQSNSLPSFLETANSNLALLQKQANTNGSSVKKFVNSFIPDLKKEAKRKGDENSMYSGGNKFSQSRKLLGSMRKIKIFDRSGSSDNYLRVEDAKSLRSTSRTPDKKKIFGQNTTGYKFMESSRQANQESGRNPQNSVGMEKERGRKRGWEMVESGGNLATSQVSRLTVNGQERKGQGRSVGKSKIFNYLQDKTEEIAPKFAYTKVDAAGVDSDKRKWLNIDEADS